MSHSEIDSRARARHPLLKTAKLFAAIAFAISAYLLFVAFSETGPAGCGKGSGCGEVLTSPWAKVFGIPVSAPALLTHAALLLGLTLVGRPKGGFPHRVGEAIVMIASAAVPTAAAWFIGLQWFALKSFCPWCLADHAAGSLAAVLALVAVFSQPGAGQGGTPKAALACLIGMGICLTGLLMGMQIAFPSAGPAVRRLANGKNDDTGPAAERVLSVLNGRRRIQFSETPHRGSPKAPKVVVVLFDYCCKYCRQTHGFLEQAEKRYPGQFSQALLPMPMNSHCNRHVEETEPRFLHACEIARLALAVWRADPSQFAAFDRWLFEPEEPRDPDDARKHAETLVRPEHLAAALQDPWIDAEIARNVEAYAASGVNRIPVILSPGMAAVVGRPSSETALFKILEEDLGLRPAE